jgi:hypothetical protein
MRTSQIRTRKFRFMAGWIRRIDIWKLWGKVRTERIRSVVMREHVCAAFSALPAMCSLSEAIVGVLSCSGSWGVVCAERFVRNTIINFASEVDSVMAVFGKSWYCGSRLAAYSLIRSWIRARLKTLDSLSVRIEAEAGVRKTLRQERRLIQVIVAKFRKARGLSRGCIDGCELT